MPSPSARFPDALAVAPLDAPPDAVLRPPGSKSLTNRALLCAAVAQGTSVLTGLLLADDTEAMLQAVRDLGAHVALDRASCSARVVGTDPARGVGDAVLGARQSGTTSRFVLPVAASRPGWTTVDGDVQLRRRPFGPLVEALGRLGAVVEGSGPDGDRLPVRVRGPLAGGEVVVTGDVSSQFLSGLLLSAPLTEQGLRLRLSTPLVSVPYVAMTIAVMSAFGVAVERTGDEQFDVAPARYLATDFDVEPDASAASYLFAAAAVTGGRVTVEGLGAGSLQGDLGFVGVLERMGASVEITSGATTVVGPRELRGVDVDMVDMSDTAQTLAVVACFATTPTRVRGIGFIRAKETDRIGAIVTELRRAGIDAVEHDDGFTVHPGLPAPTRFETYDDHRMAMSLALLGLRCPGIVVLAPRCVSKTYPHYFEDLQRLRC